LAKLADRHKYTCHAHLDDAQQHATEKHSSQPKDTVERALPSPTAELAVADERHGQVGLAREELAGISARRHKPAYGYIYIHMGIYTYIWVYIHTYTNRGGGRLATCDYAL
jgi:hypothetical protein